MKNQIIDDPFLGVIVTVTLVGIIWAFGYAIVRMWQYWGAWVAR